MSGFNAADIDALDFDFTAVGGPKGTTPEPSTAQVRGFFRTLAEMGLELNEAVSNAKGAPDLTAILDKTEGLGEQELDAIAAFCSGVPSREEIDALPPRIQRAWMGWLVAKFTDPQLSTAGTKPSLAVVQNG